MPIAIHLDRESEDVGESISRRGEQRPTGTSTPRDKTGVDPDKTKT
jgi:hypothetical protein